jgi:hypothetical protein
MSNTVEREVRRIFPDHDLVRSLRKYSVAENDIFDVAADEIERLESDIHICNYIISKFSSALKDAVKLIDNDLVGPWIAAHKLDGVLK